MVNKKSWLGMLVIALVFGIAFVGCGDDTPEEKGPPAVPTGLTGSAKSSSSVELSWNAVIDAEEYWVEYKKSSDTSYLSTFDNPRSTTYTITGLTVSTLRAYQIFCVNDRIS